MKQSTALNLLKSGQNVFLTGSAGAGKTYTLNQYIHYLRARKVPVAITASTGIAATHMNGMTIHTWSGIGIKDSLDDDDLTWMFERKYLRDNLEKAEVLIIDEVSMLHGKQLDMVNQVLKFFKQTSAPFGGLQVIVAGDFFQLPPVSKNKETNREKFCFMSAAWQEAKFNICYLSEQHRQQNNALNQILNEIRVQKVSEQSIQHLQATRTQSLEADITRLFTHNVDVEQINQRHLASLEREQKVFMAEVKGNEKLVQTLTANVRAPEKLVLKLGAKVMFVKNNMENGYINGTLGEVVGFVEEQGQLLPKVKLRDGLRLIVAPETWSIENDGAKVLASYTQIPLCLAWAITVHKSQGMTLEAAEMDLSQTFEKGQGYVALSRLKSLEGLRLLGFNDMALQLDTLAFKADQRFLELSAEAEQAWADRDAKTLHEQFVQRCGGSLLMSEIEKYEKQLAKKAKQKNNDAPTAEQTKVLLLQGLSIEEMSEKRGLGQSTIINHLAKLIEQDPSIDISRFKPTDDILQKVTLSYKRVLAEDKDENFNDDGSMKLRPLYEDLKPDLGYNAIRLALLFVVT
jgi:ATP-dependent exoDNAse (exonuclease V) alpha subunit